MSWHYDVSNESRYWLTFLGDFRPTCNPDCRELKGFVYDEDGDGTVYLWAEDLRAISKAFAEAADFLEGDG